MKLLNGLDLFSGIGGLTLALNEWVRPRYYCEQDRYAQGVLLSRMSDGQLPLAPIWDDVRTLKGEFLEMPIDIIYGGFPCQDISVAGNGVGLGGERSGLFFEIVRLAKEIKPKFLFLENVPAIRTRGLERVGQELAGAGYDCRWDFVSAQEVGAPHIRRRWFCLAHASSERRQQVARGSHENESKYARRTEKEMHLAECNGQSDSARTLARTSGHKRKAIERSGRWSPEPNVGRVVNGLPNRVDRIKGLGNAVVPAQARKAFVSLIDSIDKEVEK